MCCSLLWVWAADKANRNKRQITVAVCLFCVQIFGTGFLGHTNRAGGSPERAGCFSLNLSERICRARRRGQEGRHLRFRPFSPIFTIYLTNCVLPISRDTNLTPKCSHSLQQFRCVLLLGTENVNVCVVCCRNIRMAKPLADYADRYARFQCPRSKGMSQLM